MPHSFRCVFGGPQPQVFANVVLLAFVLSAVAYSSATAAQAFSAESSEGLVVAIDPATGVITGYFKSGTGDDGAGGPMFSCIFYFRGRAIGKPPYRTDSWFPDRRIADPVIRGTIAFGAANGRRTATIALAEEHGGCWNVQRFADTGGASFEFDRSGAWLAIRVVSAPRAYFHTEAKNSTRRKAYVTTGDPVRVLQRVSGWVRAEYTGAESGGGDTPKTAGWLREADLFPDTPTKR
jgi:hypothetical protein